MCLRSILFGTFFLVLALISHAQQGTIKARQAYLYGFSAIQIENINQRCALFDSVKIRFCREGFHASKVFSVPLLDYISKPLTYGAVTFFLREAALGYGIGVGENFKQLESVNEELRKHSFLKGLRYYFVDGLGMGVYSPGKAAQKIATSYCRSLPYSEDKALCFFGLGRASVFAKSEWFKEKDYELSFSESYHVLQGYMYAQVYANDEIGKSLLPSEPGVLAALQSRAMGAEGFENEYKLQQICARQAESHHYLCALRVLNPLMLFVAH